MILHYESLIGNGGLSDVLTDGERAYKICRRHMAPRDFLQVSFDAQVAAYEIVTGHSDLRVYAPKFYGHVQIACVMKNGIDITDDYWPDLTYSMEIIPSDPREMKVPSLWREPEWNELGPIAERFKDAGVGAILDASVLHWKSDSPKFLDFEVPVPGWHHLPSAWFDPVLVDLVRREREIHRTSPRKAAQYGLGSPGRILMPMCHADDVRAIRAIIEAIEAELALEARAER